MYELLCGECECCVGNEVMDQEHAYRPFYDIICGKALKSVSFVLNKFSQIANKLCRT